MLEKQKRLVAETEKLMGPEKGLMGKTLDQLDKRQRAELEDLKETQQKLEERTRQLLDKMDRVAKLRKEKDPETAKELRAAVEQAQQDNIGDKMKDAREQIERNA